MIGWAWIECEVQRADVQALTGALLAQGIRPRKVRCQGAALYCRCPAGQYRRLAAQVRRCGGRCRILRRRGLYFPLRPLLRRWGILLGLVCWGLLLAGLQQSVWDVQYVDLDPVETRLAAELLRRQGIFPGAKVTQPLLQAGETALVQGQLGLGWASLNFENGRLVVETAPAAEVPPIAQTSPGDIRAGCAAEILRVQAEAGTVLVQPGDRVLPGQVLIAANRPGREQRPVPGRTAGRVWGRFCWETAVDQPLQQVCRVPSGTIDTRRRLVLPGDNITGADAAKEPGVRLRYRPVTLLGMPFPALWEDKDRQMTEKIPLNLSETLARDKARSQCLAQLIDRWDSAEITQEQASFTVEDGILHYCWRVEVTAEIGIE